VLVRLKRSCDNGNNKLAYTGQRQEGFDDCVASQGPQWTVMPEEEKEEK
jgi:hypothetical protein